MDRSAPLPIPDYDHLPVGRLGHRIRTLDVKGVRALLEHEQAHGNRLPVVQLLSRRLEELRSGAAEPSGGDPAARQPEQAPAPDAGPPGSAATPPDNNQPLRHGVADQTPHRDIRAR